MQKIKEKLDKKRMALVAITALVIFILVFLMGFLIWAQSDFGYKTFTRFVQNKPSTYWLNKVYYGLYKKHPWGENQPVKTVPEEFSTTKGQTPSYRHTDLKTEITITTDKELYHSGETVKIDLVTKSPDSVNQVRLYLYGVPDKYNEYTIYETKEVNLKRGENIFNFSPELPYCNSCSGVKEGDYLIYVKLIQNSTLIGETEKKITLKQ